MSKVELQLQKECLSKNIVLNAYLFYKWRLRAEAIGILSNTSPFSKSNDLRRFAKISSSIRSHARATARRSEEFGNLRNMHRQICRSLPRCFLLFLLSFSFHQRVISRPPSRDTGARCLACVCCRGAVFERGAIPPTRERRDAT